MGRSTRRRQRRCEDTAAAAISGEAGHEVRPAVAASEAHSQALKPDEELVLRAVSTLYGDDLRPFGRILRKRVAELAAEAAEGHSAALVLDAEDLPDVDARHLREVCDNSAAIVVEAEEGGDWAALLAGRPSQFVDIYSPEDTYPQALWTEAAEYFDSLRDEEAELPGGRYSCACALMGRRLPFLEGRKLGQVCHIVQLAISQKKILRYFNGAVVPSSLERCVRSQQQCANAAGGPSGSAPTGPLQPASWEVALRFTKDIVDSAQVPPEGGLPQVPLSNVKRLFRSRYCLDLNEATLGYSKLSELLQDPRFESVCKVKLQGQGYVVVPVGSPTRLVECDPAAASPPRFPCASTPSRGSLPGYVEMSPPRSTPHSSLRGSSVSGSPAISLADSPGRGSRLRARSPQGSAARISLADSLPLGDDVRRGRPPISLVNSLMSPQDMMSPPGLPPTGSVTGSVTGTAISLSDHLLTPAGGEEFGQPRKLLFSNMDGEALTLEDASPASCAGGWPADVTPLRSPGVPGSATARRWAAEPRALQFFPEGAPLEFGSPLPISTPLPSPGVHVPGDATMRRWAGAPSELPVSHLEPAVVHSPLATPIASLGGRGSTSLRGSPDQPCHIDFFPAGGDDDFGEAEASAKPPGLPLPTWMPALTPCSLVRGGRLTKNTFIHAASPALSPLKEVRRSSSVPRNMGSAMGKDVPAVPSPECSPRPSLSRTNTTSVSDNQGSQASSSGAGTRNPSPVSSCWVGARNPSVSPRHSPRAGPESAPLKVHFSPVELNSSGEDSHKVTPRSRPLLLPVAARSVGSSGKPMLPLAPRNPREGVLNLDKAVFEQPLDWTVRNSFVDWREPRSGTGSSKRSQSLPKDFGSSLTQSCRESPAEAEAGQMLGAFGDLGLMQEQLCRSSSSMRAAESVNAATASWPSGLAATPQRAFPQPPAALPTMALQLSSLV